MTNHTHFGWKAKKRSANAIQQCFQTRILPYLALTTETGGNGFHVYGIKYISNKEK